MIRLQDYKCNKNFKASKVCIELVKFIEKYSYKEKNLNKIYNFINYQIKIPKKILAQKTCQVIFNNFNFKQNKFINYNLGLFLIDLIKYFSITLISLVGHFLVFFKKEKLFFNLICDGINSGEDLNRHLRLIKAFKKVCLISKISKKKKISSEYHLKFNYFLIGRSSFLFKDKLAFFFFGFKILYFSIINKTNYFHITSLLVYDILRSDNIFNQVSAKYFFTYKFYDTSPIFNYFFKLNGGIKTSCYQKNILAYSLSCFIFSDILFTLGKDQGGICKKIGCEIKQIVPVGSLNMENTWFYRKKKLKHVPHVDVLILGINTKKNDRHHVNYVYGKSYYYYFLNWIKKLSNDFPNLKIVIKHHSDYETDPKEKRVFENSNIKTIIKDNSINSSYANAYTGKLVISFASTMILELLGHGKTAYFIDPNFSGSQWFDDIKNIKNYRIKSYKKLRNLVLTRNKLQVVKLKSQIYYCLDSRNTSKRIISFLKK